MTVQNTAYRADYTGNGVTKTFTVPFYFLDSTHLKVLLTNNGVTPAVTTTLVLDSGYSVSGAGVSSGGSITTLAASAYDSNYTISILRDVPYAQETHYVENDPFPAASHERALDLLTMQNQQQQEELDRAVKFAPSSTSQGTMPEPVPGYAIGWDANGNLASVPNTGADQTAMLAATTGAGLVGYGAGTVEDALDKNAVDIYAARNATMTDQFSWAPPTDFIATGLTFTRDGNGNYTSSFNPDTYAASLAYTRTIYVNRATGNNTTGDGTSGLPYKTPAKAIAIAQAGADTSVRVLIVTGGADVIFYRDEWVVSPLAINGKKFYITTDDNTKKAYVTSAQEAPAWALTGGKALTYQTSRSSTLNVIDMSNKDTNGIPVPYIKKASIDEVEATAGSWYTDGTLVYVHTLSGTIPVNGTHLVNIAVSTFDFELQNSAVMFVRNCFFSGAAVSVVRNVTADLTDTQYTVYNCAFSGMLSAGVSNGFGIDSIKFVYCINSFAAYNGSDGFNFHYTRIGAADPKTYLAVCVGCESYLNGTGYTYTPGINNAFTSHEGASALYVGCKGYTCNGPIFANVNGCHSVLAGCIGWGSVSPTTPGAYYFDTGATGEVVMRDCSGHDAVYDLNSDGTINISLEDCTIATAPTSTAAKTSVRFSNFLRKNSQTEASVIPGYGSPEGVVTAKVGTIFTRLDGTAGKTLYIKETGSSSTGWVAK